MEDDTKMDGDVKAGVIIAVAFFICLTVVSVAEFYFKSDKTNEKVSIAYSLVNTKADELSKNVNEAGNFVQISKLIERDPWKNELGLHYPAPKNGVQELEVRSAGPDGIFNNEDDIAVRRWIPYAAD